MIANRVKDKLLSGELVIGTHISIPSPAIAEICGLLGFDFLIIDLEHVLFNPETFTNIVRAAENSGVVPIFRPIKNDPDLMLPYLDAGAMGVWVPGVSTADDAHLVVQAVKYQPLGNRGMTSERVSMYRLGPSAIDLIQEANKNTIASLTFARHATVLLGSAALLRR
jgi:2-keto-3-deoxy-L-rhamnonate aldolase RhmA